MPVCVPSRACCVQGDLLILLSGELFSDYNVTFQGELRDCQRNSCVTVTSYSGAKNRHLARMLSELLKCIFDWDPFFPPRERCFKIQHSQLCIPLSASSVFAT